MKEAHVSDSITIVRAGTADRDHLRELAELDSRRTPSEPALMAYVDGELRAAISLRDGVAVADPFHRTDDVVRLLRRAAETDEVSRAA
jgi:hypothetical protein